MTSTYRPLPSGRTLVIVGIVVSWGMSVAVLAGGRTSFGVFMAVGAALGTVVFGWRVALEVTLTDDSYLEWRSLVGGGRVALADIDQVRPARWQRTYLYLEVHRGRGPVVPAGRGVSSFVDSLTAARPDLPIELGAWVTRLVELDRSRSA